MVPSQEQTDQALPSLRVEFREGKERSLLENGFLGSGNVGNRFPSTTAVRHQQLLLHLLL